jgi:D-sedoheptulose 7-phosphate isomerase
MSNRIETLYQQAPAPAAFAQGYLKYLGEILGKLDTQAIARLIETFLEAREKSHRISFIGNGGSAATASHLANDIAIGTRTLDKPFRAMSLTDNVAILTAIGNDDGYADIFVQQLKALMSPGDVVVAISASGNSPNVIKAIEYANERGALTVGLTALTAVNYGRSPKLRFTCHRTKANTVRLKTFTWCWTIFWALI